MEILKLGGTLVTREPQVVLDPTLKPGAYSLELVVNGERGDSAAARLKIVVVRPVDPTAPVPGRPGGLGVLVQPGGLGTTLLQPERPLPVRPVRAVATERAVAPAEAAARPKRPRKPATTRKAATAPAAAPPAPDPAPEPPDKPPPDKPPTTKKRAKKSRAKRN